MSKMFLRRGRILPGPLKVLQRPVRRGPVPIAPLALASAAIAAGFLLMPGLSPRVSVDPTPWAESADASDAEPATRVHAAASPVAEAPTATAASGVEVPPPAAAPASIQPPATAPVRPVADASLFQLDLLPVLQEDVSGLDPAPPPAAAPQRAPVKSPSRRTMAAKGTAPSQP